MAGSKPIGSHFGVGAPPILVYGVGMFTGGTIWILSHGHVSTIECRMSNGELRRIFVYDLPSWETMFYPRLPKDIK